MPHSQDSSAEGSDLLSTSTRDSTVNEYPTNNKPYKSTTFHLPNRDTTLDSPAITGFTFTDLEPLKPLEPTNSDLSHDYPHAVTPYAQPEEQDANMVSNGVTEASKRRTQYYEDSFAYKDGHGQSAKERIQKDSPVVAELKTNVIIKDEFTVVTNLSQHLSERYRRPESAIMVNVTHSACLMMAGSFEPAYLLTISAIPSELQPVTNKRNAYLIQHFLADILHVPSSRGVIRFQDVPEQKLGTNGSTVAGEIERLEKAHAEDGSGVGHSMTSKSSRKSLIESKRKSILGGRTTEKKSELKPEVPDFERATSTQSIQSIKSLRSVKADPLPAPPAQTRQSPPPAPTSTTEDGTTTGTAQALQMHRLSAMKSTNGANGQFSISLETNKLPSRPQTANRPSSMSTTTTAAQLLTLNPRPSSSRRHASNMTGNIKDFPAPPPIPADQTPKMSKRKSFVAMFKRSDSHDHKRANA
ncbi:hypothetical protein E2P81_ATG10723 [Venturia nashicola]|uniref:L-dopachrome isomerase n=1 Tax=Venturia nashicola TaxID=86259 RepID=A0A4Z1NNW9_9PEZI|nr:hypothetical protein E6O75_ATG10391 [Venturia nashicola]TLD27435.1 hypothetical protein E2P81_ATG10723 [Venturia nashicola]